MKININPKKELFIWGPIDGRLIYPDFFNIGFVRYGKRFIKWPNVLGLFFKDKMAYVLHHDDLYKNSGLKNFKKYILNAAAFKKYYREWQATLKEFYALCKKILKIDLENLSDDKLTKLYKDWTKKYLEFWTIGQLPELSNWGGEEILKNKLQRVVPKKDFSYAFERLSAPEKLSFYQQSELDLLKLYPLIPSPRNGEGASKRRERLNRFKIKLRKLQQNHFWILNSYHNTSVLSVNYFKKELFKHSTRQANQKVKSLLSLNKKVKKEKTKIIKKYHLDKKIAKIANRLSFCVWWQDKRKFYIFLANYIIDLFLKQFANRFNVNFQQLHNYRCHELLKFLKTKKLPKISQNYRLVYYSQKNNSLTYLSGLQVKKFIAKYLIQKTQSNIAEIKGLVVSQGKKVKGLARIIDSPKQIGKMKKGDVLIAPMTSPDFIVAIKKAAAIVTDSGGMTSHAAIVSRELKIPCIVGTKIATKIFKDSDLIEVDANKGIVKKL